MQISFEQLNLTFVVYADRSVEFLFKFEVVFGLLANVVLKFSDSVVDCISDHFSLLVVVTYCFHRILCEMDKTRRDVEPLVGTGLVFRSYYRWNYGGPLQRGV